MMSITISIGTCVLIACSLAAWLYSASFLILTLENRRHWKRTLQTKVPTGDNHPRVCVMVPCKGIESGMEQNINSFLQQDHPNYRVLFIVESGHDPAVNLIQRVMRQNPTAQAKVLVAKQATNCGQKVHNLCFAVDSLSDDVDIYAFADCDAATGKSWLQWLVDCIGRENVGARTGYRWMKPGNRRLPTLLACTANNAIAAMMGRGGHHLIWGGSWAIHRSVFRATGIREAWEGTVSDDLVASQALRLSNLKILFDPRCLCSTTVTYSWSSLFEFFRRQFLIARRYAVSYWTTTLLTTIAGQVAFWGGIAAAIYANAIGNQFWFNAFQISVAGLYVTSVVRAVLRQNMGRRIDPQWRRRKTARHFDIFASPLTGLFTLAALVASCIGNTIRWRGNHYHIGQGGAVRLLGKSIGTTWPIAAGNSTDAPTTAATPLDRAHATNQGPATISFAKNTNQSDSNQPTTTQPTAPHRSQDAA